MHYEFLEWAEDCLAREPSVIDWQGLALSDLCGRAQAVCFAAKNSHQEEKAFYILEKMVNCLDEKYPWNRS